MLEHRYYGLSNPYDDLSVQSLQFHTIQQAIDDLEYFAKNVDLPMPGGDAVKPGQAPWVLIGGSYSGALTSFTVVKYAFCSLREPGDCALTVLRVWPTASRTCSKRLTPRPRSSRVSCTYAVLGF